MKKILYEMLKLPDVIGTCIINENGNPICIELPKSFSEGKMQNVYFHFSRLIQMGNLSELEFESLRYQYKQYIILAIPFTDDLILLTICRPQSNCSLITATATMLSEKITNALSKTDNDYKIGKPRNDLPQEPITIASQEKNSSIDIDAAMSAPLNLYIDQLKDLLTQYMGPFAAVIIPDGVNQWTRNGPLTSNRLSQLVDILAKELDGEDKNQFLSKAKEIIYT